MQSFMKPEKELSLRKKQDTQARVQSTPALQDKVMKAMQKDKLWRIVNEGPLKSAMGGENGEPYRLLFILRSFLEQWMIKKNQPGSSAVEDPELMYKNFLRDHETAMQMITPSQRAQWRAECNRDPNSKQAKFIQFKSFE